MSVITIINPDWIIWNGPENTGYICDNCDLPYSDHNFAGGSMARSESGTYLCNGYSQKKRKIHLPQQISQDLIDATLNN